MNSLFESCSSCDGSGVIESATRLCPVCHGFGSRYTGMHQPKLVLVGGPDPAKVQFLRRAPVTVITTGSFPDRDDLLDAERAANLELARRRFAVEAENRELRAILAVHTRRERHARRFRPWLLLCLFVSLLTLIHSYVHH